MCGVGRSWCCCQSPACSKVGQYLPKGFILGGLESILLSQLKEAGAEVLGSSWSSHGSQPDPGLREVWWVGREQKEPSRDSWMELLLPCCVLQHRNSSSKITAIAFGQYLISPVCKAPFGIKAHHWCRTESNRIWSAFGVCLQRLVFMSTFSFLIGKKHHLKIKL